MKLIVFIFPLLGWTRCQETCVTEDKGLPCVFPFRHKDKTYVGCTTDHATDGLAWCSTKVDSTGSHVKGQQAWGPCVPSCPRDVICRVLRVKDMVDDFASGLFVFTGTVLHNRPVYDNKKEGLCIFWNSEAAGWGLGYEDGKKTGGSFYSSGPNVTGEPWLGAWEDVMVEVYCEDQEIPLVPLQVLPQEAGRPVCSSQETCVTRAHCPQVQRQYETLQTLHKGSPQALDIIKQLKTKGNINIFLTQLIIHFSKAKYFSALKDFDSSPGRFVTGVARGSAVISAKIVARNVRTSVSVPR